MRKPIIFTLVPHYLPGYKGGGPIRTIASLVESLGDELDFKIVALDRDHGCLAPYSKIQANAWQKVGKAEVFYVSPEKLNWVYLRHLITNTPHDILYLNSFFSIYFGIIPMTLHRFGLIQQMPTIVAPRGQFSTGALKLKFFKKQAYINVVKAMKLHKNLIWQVSSAHEKEDVYRVFNSEKGAEFPLTTVIAPNLPDIKDFTIVKAKQKEPGNLKIAFLSRISPEKNLEFALKILTGLRGHLLFNIFGPLEDMAYWKNCSRIIENLPDNIQVCYQGLVEHNNVVQVMAEHDLFFLPTRGENFGHVIIEALAAGCPILISDQTPWRGLEKEGVGWDLPLDQPERFKATLQQCVDMEHLELATYSNRAIKYAKRKMMDPNTLNQNRCLFLNAI